MDPIKYHFRLIDVKLNLFRVGRKTSLIQKYCLTPTKRLCILVPAPYLHKISAVAVVQNLQCCYLGQIYIIFGANLATKFLKIHAEIVPSNGAI